MKAILWLCALIAAYGQSPAFELATVKASDPASQMAIRRSGHRIATVNTSLLFLITWAYDIHSERVFGKPNFLESVHYDVVGSASPDRDTAPRKRGEPTELQQMMQTLLQDRFDLVVHRETRELPMYALVLAKGGAKFQLGPSPESMGQNPFAMPGRGRLTGTQVSAEMLAKVLGDQLGRSVQDQTGLQGVFDFKLEWDPDSDTGRAGPSLFTAIQEQLGLKLEARKGPVEVLVIDRMRSVPKDN